MNTITMTMSLNNIFFVVQIQIKPTPEADHEIVENVPDLEIRSVAILPKNLEVICRPFEIPLDIPLHIIHSIF
jgi:hypothetical protein